MKFDEKGNLIIDFNALLDSLSDENRLDFAESLTTTDVYFGGLLTKSLINKPLGAGITRDLAAPRLIPFQVFPSLEEESVWGFRG